MYVRGGAAIGVAVAILLSSPGDRRALANRLETESSDDKTSARPG
ncbi:hypothetical protein RGUI_0902 [Rhodovulum sp. P5]|nr:hypothetical protein [Rhodovulum sp. P5]ARE39043.1 hypothetical protein RGUI_0902 [Rhodovulum sp. P5]